MAAFRAVAQRLAGEQLVAVAVVQRYFRDLDNGCGFGEQLPAPCEFYRAAPVGEKAVMPDPLESGWQNV